MRKLGILLALVMLFSVLSVSLLSVSPVKATSTATSTSDYVLIHLDNDNWYFDNATIQTVDWSFAGVGNYTVYLLDNRTLKIETPTLGDFIKLFAPAGYSTSNYAAQPSGTILDEILTRINNAGAVKDETTNSSVAVTLNDTTLYTTFNYSTVAVTMLIQHSYEGQGYTVNVTAQSPIYVLGWRNNRGTVTIDGTDYSQSLCPNPYTLIPLGNGTHSITTKTTNTGGEGYTVIALSIISLHSSSYIVSGQFNKDNYNVVYTFKRPYHAVAVNVKDGLTGQSLTGVTVKEGSTVLGTIDDGQSIELSTLKEQHTLTFEKNGYWSVTKAIDVQNDTSISVEMYPSSSAFKLENFPSNISILENTIYELTFTLSPIDTSATYNTYLSLTALSNILEVRKDGSLVSPENGKYYLGDISGPTQVSIKFKAGSVGTHGFTITLTSNDAAMSKTYTTTKQVTYKVEPLPFSVQMPSEWQVGTNELRISESSGQSYLVTAVLKDSQGNEVWSDSYAFSPYEAHTFNVKVPRDGTYTLEFQFNGQTAVYSVQVNPAIVLKTKTITVQKGGEGTITLHFKNPSSNVQYYTIQVFGGFLPKAINKSISVAPYTEKNISISFAVPQSLQYDAYELNVQVLQGESTVFSGKVAVSISDSGGFNLLGSNSSGHMFLYIIAGLLVLGVFIYVAGRRGRRR